MAKPATGSRPTGRRPEPAPAAAWITFRAVASRPRQASGRSQRLDRRRGDGAFHPAHQLRVEGDERVCPAGTSIPALARWRTTPQSTTNLLMRLSTLPHTRGAPRAWARGRARLDDGRQMDEGRPVGDRAEAEADRRPDRAEGAEIAAVEGSAGGDDRVQVPGSVPLAPSVAGAATGANPWQQAAGDRVQHAHPPRLPGQRRGDGPQQPAQGAAAPDGERELQRACPHLPAGPRPPGTTGADLDVVEAADAGEELPQPRRGGVETAAACRVCDDRFGHRAERRGVPVADHQPVPAAGPHARDPAAERLQPRFTVPSTAGALVVQPPVSEGSARVEMAWLGRAPRPGTQ